MHPANSRTPGPPTRAPGPARGTPSKTLALFLLAALFLTSLGCRGEREGATNPTPTNGPTPTDVHQTAEAQPMTHQEVDQRVTQYLSLTTWAQATLDVARHNPSHLPGAMMWKQDTSCIESAAALRQTIPDPDPRTALRCVRQALLNLDDSRWWDDMSAPERQARARYQLRHLWQAVDPTTRMATQAAAVYRLDVAGPGNHTFRSLRSRYSHCPEMDRRTGELASASGDGELTETWLDSVLQMQRCAQQVTHTPLGPDAEHTTDEDP